MINPRKRVWKTYFEKVIGKVRCFGYFINESRPIGSFSKASRDINPESPSEIFNNDHLEELLNQASSSIENSCMDGGNTSSEEDFLTEELCNQCYRPGLGPSRPQPDSAFDVNGAPVPDNEEFRLDVLKRYNLLDTPPEPKFDRLTALAAQMFKVPVCLISLVDRHRQFFKSNYGLGNEKQTDRSVSFCSFLLLPAKEPCLIVQDALLDSRFRNNALVVGEPNVRFYAGAPLVTKGGFILGSFCIIDFKPRTFTSEDKHLLMSLAQFAMTEIEKHAQIAVHQAEQSLRFESDKRGLLSAIDAFSEGLVLVDTAREGQPVVYANEGWEKITGYSRDEVIGMHCGTVLQGPLTDVSTVAILKEACAKGEPASVEILNYKKDGTPFWNWLRIRPVDSLYAISGLAMGPTERTGSERYYFGILSDCTARKEKELQLEKIKMEEIEREAVMKAKRQFLTNISHEIRTPMNAIIACSQLLQEAENLNPEHGELVQTISSAGQQLLFLINDILDFSKLDAGKMVLHEKEFNMWTCLDFCMEMLVLKSQTKGLDLSYNVDSSVPHWIWGDEVRLGQIIMNLLSNAAKFTDEGGEVEVSVVAHSLSSSLHIEAGKEHRRLPLFEIQFSVRDTGVGMPQDFMDVIFDPFTQCDNSRTRRYEGTGLGMAITKELVELMGGRIWVDSTLGHGSTFFFTVVAHGCMRQTEGVSLSLEEAMAVPVTPLTGKRALLVGSSDTFHRMVGSILSSWGMQCTVAHNVDEFCTVWGGSNHCSEPGAVCQPALFQLQQALGQSAGSSSRSSSSRMSSRAAGNSEASYPFDTVLVDFPVASVDQKVEEGDLDSFMMEHETALTVMQLGCACGAFLPTFLLLAEHSKKQTGIDVSKLENAHILPRPVRFKQAYKSLLSALCKQVAPSAPVSVSVSDPVPAPVPVPAPLQHSQIRILIAEDNIVNQKVLLKMLKGLGYTDCTTVVNGAKVLDSLQESSFHVILMDIQMPEMDGVTATTHIRRTFPVSHQPIIAALTADVGGDIESHCREAGMNWYLSKPIAKLELKLLLDTCTALIQSGQVSHTQWLNI